MSAKTNIAIWLSQGGSFAEGLSLYRAYGDGRNLRKLEAVEKMTFVPPSAKQLLHECLKAIPDVPDAIDDKPRRSTPRSSPNPDEPTEITTLRQRGRMLKKRESYLHAELVMVSNQPPSEERKEKLFELAREILVDIEFELDKVYGSIREWEEDGTLPVAGKQLIVQETVAKMKKRESLRTRISRVRGWLDGGKKITDQERKEYEKELLEKGAQLRTLDEELGIE